MEVILVMTAALEIPLITVLYLMESARLDKVRRRRNKRNRNNDY